ncbi:DUF6283 family protein [Burkholderia ubonensis]|uniref:DUF6283 family protein n=1 Tax=Burkholderia ubonensis TaxID=101571 RepID=UPI000AAF1908|nr:DUF6283 family protein [Burkholderia ubonensis]
MSREAPEITRTRAAGPDHQVVTVEGGKGSYRRKPCAKCPWRVDATGEFPADAFRHSAETAYDMATHTFACHEAGARKPALCAGFLLRGADHNLSVRLKMIQGRQIRRLGRWWPRVARELPFNGDCKRCLAG